MTEKKAVFFEEFPLVSYEEWKQEVERLLRGAPFEKKMYTKTHEGITLKPVYMREDLDNLSHHETMPGFAPFVRGTKLFSYGDSKWLVNQEIQVPDCESFNEALIHDLNRGLQAIHLPLDLASRNGQDPDRAPEGTVGKQGVSIASLSGFSRAFKDVIPEQLPVFIGTGTAGLAYLGMLVAWNRKEGARIDTLKGAIKFDPISEWVKQGELRASLATILDEMALAVSWCRKNTPDFGAIWVSGETFANAGADAISEVAFNMAAALEYIRQMEERGLKIEDILPHLRFSYSLGTNFFMEVSKLRAARMVWDRILESADVPEEQRFYWAHAETAHSTMTELDPYVNMLRTTTEAFSGIVGGTDSLYVKPFNASKGIDDSFSRRIARNIQYILREEAHLDKILDPAGGSWYVESLTEEIAERAWRLLQEVESKGGMIQALKEGFIQATCEERYQQRKKALASRRDVLVGVNQYPNSTETRLEDPSFDYEEFQKKRGRALQNLRTHSEHQQEIRVLQKLEKLLHSTAEEKMECIIEAVAHGATTGEVYRTLRPKKKVHEAITPIESHRVSEAFETLRYSVEDAIAQGRNLSVFTATIGPAGKYMPRLDFAASFFEVAGFKVIRTMGHDNAEAAAQKALESEAPIVVICGLDPVYNTELIPEIKRLKAADKKVFLAGFPADEELRNELLAAGLDQFFHIKTNAYDFLNQLATDLEVSQ
ncbi:MAG: methylmalonyl-CoA mutase [Acidobacteria bacterium]|nr:MAG: methylmalonyl-CoA mutase [Acidobacteriota bacterium]PIE89715.1 MAG: methylmalonyl-CoA mutase [Acidobacteriota bacterium]